MRPSLFNLRWCLIFTGLFLATGCMEARDSFHELDHVTPIHWPTDLHDAAEELTSRATIWNAEEGKALGESESMAKELADLVNWIPEIAADTDMPESQWQEFHDLTLKLRTEYQRTNRWNRGDMEALIGLCENASPHATKAPTAD